MMGTKIITVTLNPSLDRTLVTHHLAIGYHNLTQETTCLDPAGQGLGISRALSKLGIPTQAIVLTGDDATGKAYRTLISEEEFEITVIVVSGQTRSKTIIWDTGKNTETQITEESADISQNDIHNVVSALHQKVEKNDLVIYAGPLPKGIPDNTYAWLSDVAHEEGASVGIVASGQPLIDALKAHPSLIALNRIEIESIFNYPVRVMKDVVNSAKILHQYGAQEVLIERRNAGKVLFAKGGENWLVNIPNFEQGTSSGIWDAFLGGFLSGRFKQSDLDESLTLGASAAFYTASQVGHKFGSLHQIKECGQGILISRLENADMDHEKPQSNIEDIKV